MQTESMFPSKRMLKIINGLDLDTLFYKKYTAENVMEEDNGYYQESVEYWMEKTESIWGRNTDFTEEFLKSDKIDDLVGNLFSTYYSEVHGICYEQEMDELVANGGTTKEIEELEEHGGEYIYGQCPDCIQIMLLEMIEGILEDMATEAVPYKSTARNTLLLLRTEPVIHQIPWGGKTYVKDVAAETYPELIGKLCKAPKHLYPVLRSNAMLYKLSH